MDQLAGASELNQKMVDMNQSSVITLLRSASTAPTLLLGSIGAYGKGSYDCRVSHHLSVWLHGDVFLLCTFQRSA